MTLSRTALSISVFPSNVPLMLAYDFNCLIDVVLLMLTPKTIAAKEKGFVNLELWSKLSLIQMCTPSNKKMTTWTYKGINRGESKYFVLSSGTEANNCFYVNHTLRRTATTLTDKKWIFPLPTTTPKTDRFVIFTKQATWQDIYRLSQPIKVRGKCYSLGVKFWKNHYAASQ